MRATQHGDGIAAHQASAAVGGARDPGPADVVTTQQDDCGLHRIVKTHGSETVPWHHGGKCIRWRSCNVMVAFDLAGWCAVTPACIKVSKA